ncbi:MAG: DUF1800 domain-containing protein [Cytophagaceae bacterium]|nr:DUF1800 domain-containing protein [Cytophagaceae bacterium]
MPVWNRDTARHLLSRALFGYRRADLDRALSYPTLDAFVDKELLSDNTLPPPPGIWVDETPVANDPNIGARTRELVYWWYDQMLTQGPSLREKMVLFFHSHFTSERDKVNYPQFMHIQNALFRKYAFGDLRQLTKDVTTDPAMLIYLDGRGSNKNGPNENYARELLELFTLGIGNYTETDIKQAAKALTGWRVNGLKSEFDATRFDTGQKTFLGKTGNFGYKEIVDIVYQQDVCAEFWCRKLCTEFQFYKPDAAFVKKLAAILRANDFTLKPVLKALFTSDEFYASNVIGAKIKSPTELLIGTLKALDVPSMTAADWGYVYDMGRNLQQWIFEPPNVAGWPGQRDWISSNTYPQRGGYSDALINGRQLSGRVLNLKFKPIDYARTYAKPEDAVQLVEDISNAFMQFPLSAVKKKQLLDALLDGTIVANWSTNTPMADARINRFLKALMRLPEYQLC